MNRRVANKVWFGMCGTIVIFLAAVIANFIWLRSQDYSDSQRPVYILDFGNFIDNNVRVDAEFIGIFGSGRMYVARGSKIIFLYNGAETDVSIEDGDVIQLVPQNTEGIWRIAYFQCSSEDLLTCEIDYENLKFLKAPNPNL